MRIYLLNDGTETTPEAIKAAFTAGNARLVHSHGDHHTKTGLLIDGVDRDTRGQCCSMWDEVWTRTPKDVHEALRAAACNI